jgi:hypothetical protein
LPYDVADIGDGIMDPTLFDSMQVVLAVGILAVTLAVASYLRRHFQ